MFNKSTNNNQQLQEESALDSAKTHDFPTTALSPPAKGSRIPRLGAQNSGAPLQGRLRYAQQRPESGWWNNKKKSIIFV